MFKAKMTKNTKLSTKDIRKHLKKAFVKVGVPKSTGAVTHDNSSATVATIAAVHEFGSPGKNIPERSFIRSTIQEENPNIKKLFNNEVKKVVEGDSDVDSMLGLVGTYTAGQIQKKITDLRTPENAPATIAAKGSSNPLIDTGQMRQSVTFEVIDE